MITILANPYRGADGNPFSAAPYPSIHADLPLAMLARCPEYARTPLVKLSNVFGVASVIVKDERERMGLGSFKALGAAYVIAHHAAEGKAKDQRYVTASAGNHGLSLAAGARAFDAQAVVFLSDTVPEAFAERLQAIDATVIRAGDNYEASMRAAQDYAKREGATLLSDSSWNGYTELPHRLMEGYTAMGQEIIDVLETPPTHILLQAGVGGLAGAMAAIFRHAWGDDPRIIIVEPDAAPAIIESIRQGAVHDSCGPVSTMGRLDCKTPSIIAMHGLARDADYFLTLSDDDVDGELGKIASLGLATSPSGGAGIAALGALGQADRARLGIADQSRVLTILSEGAS